jgi:pyruvate dehydrogenase E2 component (dihydrolipoamide acetyltransferase)
MPKVDMDMTEGKIAHWYVKAGDKVSKGQLLFEIETDKATMEVDSPAEGVIQNVNDSIGVAIDVGTPVAWIYAEGEVVAAGAMSAPAAATLEAPAAEEVVAADPLESAEQPEQALVEAVVADGQQLLRATPLARSAARQLGIDLGQVAGSGPGGRIQFADLPAPAEAQREAALEGELHLNWISKGEAAPLVMLHGFGADHASWRVLASHFSNVPIVGIDLPNHGKSPLASVGGIAQMAEMVHSRLLAEGICDFHLVGHSMGGAVAAELAALAGDRLKSLTLLAPAGLGPDINIDFIRGLCRARSEASLKPWLELLFADAGKLTGSFLVTAAKQLQKDATREALLRLSEELMPDGTQVHSIRPALEQLRAPVRVMWGSQDRIIPLRHASMLPSRAALHVLPAVGHLPQVEAAELVAEVLSYQLR